MAPSFEEHAHHAVPPSTDELAQIRYALDQSAIVAVTDVQGRIKYVNDKFCEISKYARDELLGQDHRIINSGYHPPEYIRDLWVTIAHGRIWRGELRNRAKDGSIYWMDTTIVPFLNEHGKPWQYMSIRYDITERKRQEDRLRQQATLARVGEMAAVVAHEVRNPLAGIRGGVQMLASYVPAGVEGRDLLTEIIARIDSLNAVLTDLLTFARVRELKKTDFDLAILLSDLVAAFRLDPGRSDIDVQLAIDGPVVVHADVDQLRLVLSNILFNAGDAIEASPGLEARPAPEGRRIWIAVRASAATVAIDIRDSGPGMPASVRARVFEPFFTTKHRGSGLGLPTARRIIDAHDGTIEIDAPAQGGTVVTVTLPRRAGSKGPSTGVP